MDRNDNELLKLVPFLEKLVELVCLLSFIFFKHWIISRILLFFPLIVDLSIPLQNEDVRPHIQQHFRLHDLLPPD